MLALAFNPLASERHNFVGDLKNLAALLLSIMAGTTQNAIARTVHFYRVYSVIDESNAPKQVDIAKAIREISKLPFVASDGHKSRYLEEDDGKVLACWTDKSTNRLKVGRTRRRFLPFIEKGGEFGPLPIDSGTGVVDFTHLRFFDQSIVGALFNGFSPRTSAVSRYLAARAKCSGAEFELLINPDVLAQRIRHGVSPLSRPDGGGGQHDAVHLVLHHHPVVSG